MKWRKKNNWWEVGVCWHEKCISFSLSVGHMVKRNFRRRWLELSNHLTGQIKLNIDHNYRWVTFHS